MKSAIISVSMAIGVSLSVQAASLDSAAQKQATAIITATGFRSGLVVHVGCGNGHLTAALRGNDQTLVQGLDADHAKVGKAREYLHSLDLYGPVSVQCWQEPFLPYVDDTVNLLVADRGAEFAEAEILRVLAPRGVAYIKRGG